MPLLEVENLGHRFADGSWGIRNVSFALEQGGFTVLTGRNGSGKTILVKHLNGLLKPTEGRVLLDGKPVQSDLLAARTRVGLVFQNPYAQVIQETVREDAAFGPENLGLPPEESERRVREALSETGLTGLEERYTGILSGGEIKRLALAGVIAMEPEIIIFDEPFAGLDYPGMKQCIAMLTALKTGGKTLIVITHHHEKLTRLADRMLIMNQGRLAEDGRPEAVLARAEAYGVAGIGVQW
ncbi:MAG: energy-coupling factor ABC transporter ATP-binding protein [Spirochaetales bacterium]|nr:MAG: energy-coupling factor ABC transporter ATP-binding protein [Spirochaetales bacterium]